MSVTWFVDSVVMAKRTKLGCRDKLDSQALLGLQEVLKLWVLLE